MKFDLQMPLGDGKQGYFQIQNAAGQTVNIVTMVTSGQSVIAPPTSISVQSSSVSQVNLFPILDSTCCIFCPM